MQKKIIGILAISYFLLSIIIVLSNYFSGVRHAESIVLDRQEYIVKRIADSIDGDMHLSLSDRLLEKDAIKTSYEDESYLEIHKILKEAYHNNNLSSPIYTYVKSKNEEGIFEFLVTSNDRPYYRHLYRTFPVSCADEMERGGSLPRYGDEFGDWLSAFSPIRSKSGEVVAYVQIDQPFSSFISPVRKTSMIDALIFLVGFLFMGLLTLPHIKKVLREEQEVKKQLESSLEDTKKLSEELTKNEETLIRVNQDLKDFAHIASHDLKSPLKNIKLFSQLLNKQDRHNLSDDSKEYLDFIITGVDKSQNLINELLAYSESEKTKTNIEVFNLKDAVKLAKENLKAQIKHTKAEIIVKELPEVSANKLLISQLFQNLISNGLKYNKSNKPQIEIGCRFNNDDTTYFYVKDNGIGIAHEHRSKIFKMFSRLHSDAEYEGSGIGLAFCMRIVQAYGGELWLNSDSPDGSVFCFTLDTVISPQLAAVS